MPSKVILKPFFKSSDIKTVAKQSFEVEVTVKPM
jgi:hypothetical protein